MKALRRATRIVGLLVLIASGAFVAWFFDSDPQGEEDSVCEQVNKASIPSGAGMSVTTHTTVCTAWATTIVTYVYVHPSTVQPNGQNLVFRYNQLDTADPPTLSWIDERHLLVEANRIGRTSKLEEKFGVVSIAYKITHH